MLQTKKEYEDQSQQSVCTPGKSFDGHCASVQVWFHLLMIQHKKCIYNQLSYFENVWVHIEAIYVVVGKETCTTVLYDAIVKYTIPTPLIHNSKVAIQLLLLTQYYGYCY